MATWIVDRPGHTVNKIQFGATEFASTLNILTTIWGGIGGLQSIGQFLGGNSLKTRKEFDASILKISEGLLSRPLEGWVFLNDGPLFVSYGGGSSSGRIPVFGDHPLGQKICLIICALAYHCDGDQAIRLFMKCLAPLIVDPGQISDALYSQLTDLHKPIVTEGNLRGLSKDFDKAVESLNLQCDDPNWSQRPESERKKPSCTELDLAGGLLRWLAKGDRGQLVYYTRSSLVARMAACLRQIGFRVGNIRAWNGIGDPPGGRTRSLVLVLGGTMDTDSLMLGGDDVIPEYPWVHHYRYETTGAMLTQSLYDEFYVPPEVAQAMFEDVDEIIHRIVHLTWQAPKLGPSQAQDANIFIKAEWTRPSTRTHPIARSLAAILFPRLADNLAGCYERMATEEALGKVKTMQHSPRRLRQEDRALVDFRLVSASILISLASQFAPNFKDCRHSISLKLTTKHWLDPLARIYDGTLMTVTGIGLGLAVRALAAVHAGVQIPSLQSQENGSGSGKNNLESLDMGSSFDESKMRNIIGWRNGVHSIVPSLFRNMEPSERAIGLHCMDEFWANAIVQDDGSVKSGSGTGIFEQSTPIVPHSTASTYTALEQISNTRPYLGVPSCLAVDVPLYLSIERPRHYSSQELSFCGRVNGISVGSVSVLDILFVLIRSLDDTRESRCPGEHAPSQVINVKPSHWIASEFYKPIGGDHTSYIPVLGDKAWALFLAGQTRSYDGRITFGCTQCAHDKVEVGSALIGFK